MGQGERHAEGVLVGGARTGRGPPRKPLEGDEAAEVLRRPNPPEIVVEAERRQPGLVDEREQRPRLAAGSVGPIETREQPPVRRRLERVQRTTPERVVEKGLPEIRKGRPHDVDSEVAGRRRLFSYSEGNARVG